MARLLLRDGAPVQRGRALLTVPQGGASDCECCGCVCRDDLAETYTILCPCILLLEGDDCDGVGDCAWYGESGCGPFMLDLRDDCQWVISGLADPKDRGTSRSASIRTTCPACRGRAAA